MSGVCDTLYYKNPSADFHNKSGLKMLWRTMESSLFTRLFKGIFKFVFSSLLLGAISLVGSTYFMTGKFPPDWKQIKNMLGTVQKLRDVQKIAGKGAGGADLNAFLATQGQNPQAAGQVGKRIPTAGQSHSLGSANQVKNNNSMVNEDPELADIREIVQGHENMRNLAASLNGEKTLDAGAVVNQQAPTNNRPANQAQNVNSHPVAPTSLDARLRALELQVENLTLRLRSLTSTVMDFNARLERMPKTK
jgi:hypothetical protein